jgi:hypothetical protein
VINSLTLKEVYTDMRNNFFRMIVYQSEAYIKSTCLISTLAYLIGDGHLNYYNFSFGIALGIVQLLIAPAIYVLDAFFCEKTPVAEIPVENLSIFFK